MANSYGHQSPASSLPPLSGKTVNTGTWGTGGNSVTITDEYCHTNSIIHVVVTGTVPAAGNWSITASQGSFVITSDTGESSTLAIAYIIL